MKFSLCWFRFWRSGLLLAAVSGWAHAETFTLDDSASPIKVEFDGATAGLKVTTKASGVVWRTAESDNEALKLSRVKQSDALHLTADAEAGRVTGLHLALTLKPATGDLVIALGGEACELGHEGIVFPRALFPADGSGYAILPFFGGYAVPTSQTKWTVPWSHSRMEWFGGVDQRFEAGWMYIAEPAADMQLTAVSGKIAGESRLGGAFHWIGSNANPEAKPGRLSYERRAVLHCFDRGGYVAQAKHFRTYAQAQGWFRSLKEKAERNPDVDRLVGAPVIYLWGDGRSEQMLDALKSAGLDKALIQLSINHVDQEGAFPSKAFADGDGWAKAVHARGYLAGIYDIYAAARVGSGAGAPPRGDGPRPPQTGGLRYSGFTYLWPKEATDWNYVGSGGERGQRAMISHQMSAKFAVETRLPQHIKQFGLDAFFFDTVCALEPSEDYDTAHGHPATRTKDIANRIALLDATTGHFNKLTGTEQIKSWAVPEVHWAEGMFKLGASNAKGQIGAWNSNVYPQVMTDVQDLGENLRTVLDTGFQVPLWELVYHDALLSVQHWHLVHNKLLYCWDLADQFALIRGQAPILNLVYAGEKGSVGREVEGAKDADGRLWDTRWTNPLVAKHVAATYQSVCKWHGQIGYLEMTNHQVLADDFSVQLSEFSADGGKTGRGIIVNFGHFDGAHAMTGPAWSGEVRGKTVRVAFGDSAIYTW